MKKYILVVIIICSGCCDDFYPVPVTVSILRDGRALSSESIYPSFQYIDPDGIEKQLNFITGDSCTYIINQTEQIRQISFEPKEIIIRYNGLLDIDTLEILLDYACDQKSRCKCNYLELKYMKFDSVVLPDNTIRKHK